MILNIRQTKNYIDMEWLVTDTSEELYTLVKAPFATGKFQADAFFKDKSQYTLYYNPTDAAWGNKLKDRLSFKILQDGNYLGAVVGQTKKLGFLKSYAYYEFTFNNEVYYGYEVGFGFKGLYLCIYKGEQLIAVVDKTVTVVNFKDCYTAYMLDEQYAKLVVLFVVYYDVIVYGDPREIALLSVQQRTVNTIQKELIAKYDPDFIAKIKAMEYGGCK